MTRWVTQCWEIIGTVNKINSLNVINRNISWCWVYILCWYYFCLLHFFIHVLKMRWLHERAEKSRGLSLSLSLSLFVGRSFVYLGCYFRRLEFFFKYFESISFLHQSFLKGFLAYIRFSWSGNILLYLTPGSVTQAATIGPAEHFIATFFHMFSVVLTFFIYILGWYYRERDTA